MDARALVVYKQNISIEFSGQCRPGKIFTEQRASIVNLRADGILEAVAIFLSMRWFRRVWYFGGGGAGEDIDVGARQEVWRFGGVKSELT
jgi:hypothetical protein